MAPEKQAFPDQDCNEVMAALIFERIYTTGEGFDKAKEILDSLDDPKFAGIAFKNPELYVREQVEAEVARLLRGGRS